MCLHNQKKMHETPQITHLAIQSHCFHCCCISRSNFHPSIWLFLAVQDFLKKSEVVQIQTACKYWLHIKYIAKMFMLITLWLSQSCHHMLLLQQSYTCKLPRSTYQTTSKALMQKLHSYTEYMEVLYVSTVQLYMFLESIFNLSLIEEYCKIIPVSLYLIW